MDRIAMLSEILTQNPADPFARYGLAMEYFMAAQTLARANRIEEAKRMLHDGILSAQRTGNSHAQSEMEAMLADLG